MNYSPIIKILTLQSSIKINEIKSFYFKHRLSKTTRLTRNTFLILFFSVCTGHKRNIKEINENSYRLYRYQHVEVDSSLFVSESISGVRCWKLRHYSIIPFLLSLSAYSELTAIKTFTGINLAQSLHVCKPWCKRVLVWYPLARLHGLKQKYWHNQLSRPPYRKHTEPWHHCVKSNRTLSFVNRYTPNIYIYIST